jgi:hypothetical protein
VIARCVAAVALLTLAGAGAKGQAPAPLAAESASPAVTARSPRNASYSINARLDPDTRAITGDEILTWRNISASPANSLRFHLYYNAWRNTQSSWIRERQLAGDTTLAERTQSEWGWIDINTLRLLGDSTAPADVTSRIRFIAPDDGNTDDRTVAEVPLDVPVKPGETVRVQITWSSRVPRTFARTGAIADFFFLAQWFPKIAVLQDSGWNSHQFHAATEFFSDFGTYSV